MIEYFKKIKFSIYANYKLRTRYGLQSKRFRNSNVKFYNYGPVREGLERYWFYRFIKHHQLNPKAKTINFISVFGDIRIVTVLKGVKIFFTGENLYAKDSAYPQYVQYEDHLVSKVDLALGFNYADSMPDNYMRFPLFYHYLVPAESTLESLKVLIKNYNSFKTRYSKKRNRFAVQISKYDRNGVRKEIIEALNQIDTVICAGNFMNNSDELKVKFNDNKLAYLKNFKFHICPENSSTEGYVTEKIFHAIMAGCIPIYWGSNNQPELNIINPKAVLFYDKENPEMLIKKVMSLMESEKAYEEFLRIPPFQKQAAEIIWERLCELRNRLECIIDNN